MTSQSIDQYSKQLESAPDDVATRNMRGWNYVKLKRYDLAADDFRKSIELAPEDAEAHTLFGYLMALQGDETASEISATKGVLYGGQSYLVLHNVACIYAELARASSIQPKQRIEYEDAALAVLARAIKLAHQNPAGVDLIEIIRNEPAYQSLKERTEFQQMLATNSIR